MKKILHIAVALACSIACAQTVSAEPMFDNASWNQIFDGKDAQIPSEIPTGKGVVSNMNPTQKMQIVNPYDMRQNPYITLSDYAVEANKYYASQTQKDFLEAATKQFRKLTGDKNSKLPVAELTFNEFEFPMPLPWAYKSAKIIELGWFGSLAGISQVVPHGSYNQAKNSIRATSKVSLLDASYAKYVELCKQQITELRKLEGKRLTTKLREIHNQAREAVKPSSANKNKNNDLLEEKWARIEAREKAGEAGWDHDFNGGDALADDREERRKNIKKNRQNRQCTQYYQVDLANTWNMIEAIVTQNAVRIEKLSIPLAIEEVLLLHAKTNKRPENIIRRVMELNIDNKSAAGNISVTLACSTRDRFMGCRQVNKYRDDAEEQQIQLFVNRLEKTAKKANSTQKEILNTLINNAYGKLAFSGEEEEMENSDDNQASENKQSSKNKKKAKKTQSGSKLVDQVADLPF